MAETLDYDRRGTNEIAELDLLCIEGMREEGFYTKPQIVDALWKIRDLEKLFNILNIWSTSSDPHNPLEKEELQECIDLNGEEGKEELITMLLVFEIMVQYGLSFEDMGLLDLVSYTFDELSKPTTILAVNE